MTLRARKKEEKLLRIEAAGRALFSEKGFAATTTRDLAKHAGIGTGTFFVYFPQKQDLLIHLFVRDVSAAWSEALASLDPTLELLDALMHVFGALYDYYAHDKRLSRVFVQELMFTDPDAPNPQLTTMALEFMAEVGALITRAKERGELHTAVAEPEAAFHFFGAYSFNLISWLGGNMPAPHHRWMLQRALTLLVDGMKSAG